MHTTSLAVPPALLDILRLRPGAKVGIAVESGRLVVAPQRRPRYTLDELLAQCNPKAARSKEEREWLGNRTTGGELL
jgi:antitoxin ChpS